MHTQQLNRARRNSRRALPSLGRLILFALTLALAPLGVDAFAQAQATGSGTITGRVLNADNGMYLSKARVTVEGTSIEAFTNDFGEYQLRNVPTGEVKIVVTYTGQEQQIATVTVQDGATTTYDAQFKSADTDGVVVLDPFVVETRRFKSAQELAIQEERVSVNIKNVVAADSLGFIQDGNIGEFVQFLPGVDIGYGGTYVNDNDASSISVRGFGPEDTNIMIDGMSVAGASAASLTRAVGLDMMSINNASRIEVTKVATPDMAQDSPGGSINLITRSAFEFAKPTFAFDANLSTNTIEPFKFSKQPGPANKNTYHTLPGLRMSMTWPISKTFGLSASLSSDNKYSPGQRYSPRWVTAVRNQDLRPLGGANATPTSNALGVASQANPYLERASINDQPWNTFKQSGNLKLDWRPFNGMTISSNVQYSRYTGINVDRRVQFQMGSAQDWGSDFVQGYQYQVTSSGTLDPRHSTGMTITSRDKEGDTLTMYLTAKYQRAGWSIDGAAKRSTSNSGFEDVGNKHFSGLDMSLTTGRIDYLDIRKGIPGTISLWDSTGAPLDYSMFSNWVVDSTINAQSGESFSKDVVDEYLFNVKRDLDFMPFPTAIKVGWARKVKDIRKWGRGTGYKMRYTGPQLTSTELADAYVSEQGFYGMQGQQQWASTYKLYEIYERNPELFNPDYDVTYSIGNYNSSISQTRSIKESSDSVYAMLEASFFNNRVSLVAGARQKESSRVGRQGYVDSKFNYIRLPTGLVYTDSIYTQGVKYDGSTGPRSTGGNYARDAFLTDMALRTRMQAAGAIIPDSLQLSQLPATLGATGTRDNNLYLAKERYKTRDINVSRREPATPQIQVAIKLTKALDLKLSWSRETKLQNIEVIANQPMPFGGETTQTQGILTGGNSLNIDESLTPDGSLGSAGKITISNPALKPELSNSYNAELAYHTDTGGKFSVSYFYKQISNVWESIIIYNNGPEYEDILTSFGLNPLEYENWTMTTTINSAGKGTRDGIEADVRQNLGVLGGWAKGIDVFATYSHRANASSDLPTNPTGGFIAKMPTQDKYSGGIMFSTKRASIAARMIYIESGLKREGTFDYPVGITSGGTRYQTYKVLASVLRLNLEASYQLSERYSIFLSASDVLRAREQTDRIQDVMTGIMPEYGTYRGERNRGVILNLGISGRF